MREDFHLYSIKMYFFPLMPLRHLQEEIHAQYCISLVIRQGFFPSKTITKILICLIRPFMGPFRKGKTHIIAKFHWTDFVICSHLREGKIPSYSQINTVVYEISCHLQSMF